MIFSTAGLPAQGEAVRVGLCLLTLGHLTVLAR
jgi:hypothetical protein